MDELEGLLQNSTIPEEEKERNRRVAPLIIALFGGLAGLGSGLG
jgi:hypothetical protein